MARKPTGRPDGRPPLPFDMQQFEEMCGISCTKAEIASVLKMSEDTLEHKIKEHYGETFSVAYKRFQGTGKQSLRRMQLQAAQNGNVTMLIWLGKQWLGQKEIAWNPAEETEPPIRIHISGKPDAKDLDPSKNDNLEISKGKDGA